ncbi:peptide chain release factor 1 [Oscillatoria sp. FACHB-1407]|uniref:peptide chain release factor 1 n=1 Tax=Oscillatoria sp. FACHB-1407 TaxID=2692847 RepID=UPI0016827AD8|nr:peptide chain release factor 1 [Oscillatoria sp. FACHB-1407]MBD2459472.1 peptide chain release factor 1 [Oscillatoria sp. FACHB-1407]
MANPLQRLKLLPWSDLMQVAGLTLLLTTLVDSVLKYLDATNPLLRDIFDLLLEPPLEIITLISVSAGVGALAFLMLERFFQRVIINTGTLWALVLCLIIAIAIKGLIEFVNGPFGLLLTADQASLIGLVLGVFLISWKYWRHSSGGGCCG